MIYRTREHIELHQRRIAGPWWRVVRDHDGSVLLDKVTLAEANRYVLWYRNHIDGQRELGLTIQRISWREPPTIPPRSVA